MLSTQLSVADIGDDSLSLTVAFGSTRSCYLLFTLSETLTVTRSSCLSSHCKARDHSAAFLVSHTVLLKTVI